MIHTVPKLGYKVDTEWFAAGRRHVGYDLDGTIYGWVEQFMPIAQRYLGRELSYPEQWDVAQVWNIEQQLCDRLHAYAVQHHNLFRTGEPLPGAVEAIHRIAAKHDVSFVTARVIPGVNPDTIREATQEWLDSIGLNGFPLVITTDKTGIGLDILIDDAEHNVRRAWETGEQAVLYANRTNRSAHYRYPTVHTHHEFAALVAA